MRLAQLARKVGKNQSELIKFLNSKGVAIEDASNAKVSDVDATLVIEYFAPELLTDITAAMQEDDTLEGLSALPVEVADNPQEAVEGRLEGNRNVVQADLKDVALTEKAEVIKAPKIELQGLKVLGKIELPEDRKKDAQKQRAAERPKDAKASKERKTNPAEARKNPIALQREKEEEEKRRKKVEHAAYQKELRTQRYLNKVRKPTDVLYKEPKQKPIEVKPVAMKREVQAPSFFSKLIGWLFGKK
jgi:flagellar biosynthesis GTPase FlhF